MAIKSSKAVIALEKIHQGVVLWNLELLAAKRRRTAPHWLHAAAHDLSTGYILGRIEAANTMLESLMHAQNCYWGYEYVNSKGEQITCNDPEYRDCARKYIIKT